MAEGATDDLVMLDLDHEVAPTTWLFERSAATTPGTAPIALDIGSTEEATWSGVADRAEALGAERLAEHEDGGVRWIELRDPDGNRFRVFAPRPVG